MIGLCVSLLSYQIGYDSAGKNEKEGPRSVDEVIQRIEVGDGE